jgi:3-methyladenine DNA glycosylase AlkD
VPVLEVRSPDLKNIARRFDRSHRELDLRSWEALADRLWRGRTFEERALGVELLRRRLRRLDAASWRMLDG